MAENGHLLAVLLAVVTSAGIAAWPSDEGSRIVSSTTVAGPAQMSSSAAQTQPDNWGWE